MKVCPFCKEEIRDEAIKCRYCMSSLLPPQAGPATASPPAGTDKNQTVYVVDQDLVRFGKFAAGVLAVFVAVGIFLYGIDIKQSLKDVESSTSAARDSARAVEQSADSIDKMKTEVTSDEQKATDALSKTQASEAALLEQVQDVQAKQSQTSDAAAKAQAAEKSIEAAQRSMDQAEQSSSALLAQAQKIAGDILAKQQEVDKFVAHIETFSGAESATAEAPASAPPDAEPVGRSTSGVDRSFTPPEIAAAYNFPSKLNGAGQTIGLIELGGGYRDADIAQYFKQLGIPVPTVTSVSIDGAKNSPSDANSADGEVEMDIEVAGSIAPGAHIVVIFCPNTSQGYLDGILAAVNNNANRISVLAICWGGPESSWTQASMQSINSAFQAAAAHNITVLAASGDNGPSDGVGGNKLAVDFPASSPWVLAVGGTHLHVSTAGIESESPWDDGANMGASGRGVSSTFGIPDWQAHSGVPQGTGGFAGRAIPDVSADASPATGYQVFIDGQAEVLGGTAASTPLWAGLIALINQGAGHNVGFINQKLYQTIGPTPAFRQADMKAGSSAGNSAASGKPGWSPLTGWGSPNGEKLLSAFMQRQ